MGIEYDPNRSARIALIKYTDGELSYILAPSGLQVVPKLSRATTSRPISAIHCRCARFPSARTFTISS